MRRKLEEIRVLCDSKVWSTDSLCPIYGDTTSVLPPSHSAGYRPTGLLQPVAGRPIISSCWLVARDAHKRFKSSFCDFKLNLLNHRCILIGPQYTFRKMAKSLTKCIFQFFKISSHLVANQKISSIFTKCFEFSGGHTTIVLSTIDICIICYMYIYHTFGLLTARIRHFLPARYTSVDASRNSLAAPSTNHVRAFS